jgi:hypothetical protein
MDEYDKMIRQFNPYPKPAESIAMGQYREEWWQWKGPKWPKLSRMAQ